MIYYTSLGCFFPSFFFFSIFFISALPTRTTTLFPLPSVECVREYRHRTRSLDTCFCLFFFFFFFSARPSAADAVCLACRKAIGAEQPKVTLMKTEGAFCLSALPSRAVHPPISAVAWLPPTPVILEPCQHTPLDRDMQILSSGNGQPSRPCTDCDTALAKNMSFQTQERGLISHSLSPESMLVSGSGVHILSGNRYSEDSGKCQ